ncbi:hypothetical protein SCLCIDRAFT_22878 [Scleroderma citrinum Foug A]|uniref:Aspartic peptidase DDI1-type domain-containing protein n=1 Tax=Scleroderma citrinum Foug A TaxID=1036808 RepID=A0A0C3DXU8_9AGAM|nr:hypothetical protein SCLCIDRAFT_22878 [Scleroderma citrinum Foug A]
MSIMEGVVKSRGISAEHSPMEQILVEVQRMESALKMISSYSWAQQVKSSHKSLSVDDCMKDRPSSGNSDGGSKYFCRGNKQDKARLFTVEVQDTNTDGEQDEQDDAAQDTDEPGPSPSSDDDEDQVNGPQYSSDDEDIVKIYDDDDDSNGEPVACLRRMSTHDPSDKEVVRYLYMSIAEDDSDEFSKFKGDNEHKDLLNEYEVHCVVLETGDLGSHEQSCNGDISIRDLLEVPALRQEIEYFNAPQETAEEVAAEARLSTGEEHRVYLQSDQSIIPDGPYILGEYEAIRICNPVPQEDLPNGSGPRMMAMRPAAGPTGRAFRYAMRMDALTGPPGPRPLVPAKLCTCFVVHAKVNGCEALMMVDTGSTTNFVSPAFATVAKLAAFTLESQLALQLGCVGSQSKITHGAHAPVCIGNITRNTYFDVANINQYNCILGLLFLRNN